MKITIPGSPFYLPLVSTSAANEFVMPDGLANLPKIQTLGDRAKKYLSKEGVLVDGFYMMPRRAKPVPHSATKEKAKDVKYLKARSIKIVYRKRLTDMGQIKNAVLLPLIYGEGVPRDLISKINQAHKALERHQDKSEIVKEKVAKVRTEIRQEDDKNFTQSLNMLYSVLEAGGLKSSAAVPVRGMFGTAVLLKLDGDNVVQITKSDASKFRAAKRMAEQDAK